jgi:UDP-2,4-diacetamido-2,4,6-trideoxy-beta-L-altropyranose hydrolase
MHDTVLFRCDASPELGMGHVFRCCTLAAEWHRLGGRSLMLGPDKHFCPPEFTHVFSDWQACSFDNEVADASRTCDHARKHQANKLVLDDYRIHDDYQLVLKYKGMHWLQFDGAAQKNLWADWVVNAVPGIAPDLYADRLMNPHTRLLLGPDYALLRPEFTAQTPLGTTARKARRVFVFAGGGDDKQVLKLLLSSLLSLAVPLTVCVVTTSNNPGLNDLVLWIEQQGQHKIELHIDASDMSALMRSCSMALVSGGTVTYEVNATGLPMVLFSMAQNQNAQAQAWVASASAQYLGDYQSLSVAAVQTAVMQCLQDEHKPVKRLVDGQGARRIVQEMMALSVCA